MRKTLLALLASFPALACAAPPFPEGRWEGVVDIPGRPVAVVVDLAPDRAGAWQGSIVLPGLGIKGAPLSSVSIEGPDIAFIVQALGGAKIGTARVQARLAEPDRLAGALTQGGNAAALVLRRIGPAQVEAPPRSTAIRAEAEGRWAGEYELGGYPRRVTLDLRNHTGAGATADLTIVGKQTTVLPIDLVIEDGAFIRVESQSSRVAFEGRLLGDRGELNGAIELGSIALPLVLRRAAAGAT